MEAMAWLIFRGYFYPRPPRGGRRGKKMVGVASNKFLSTPSARRATGKPRPWRRHKKFSIHALREEGDPELRQEYLDILEFLSTPSARRATKGAQLLRARRLYFYPRPPRGGRQPRSGLH